MDQTRKNEIYERLLAINLQIDSSAIPNPAYINSKIGQCHIFIDEVEKFAIQINQEISVIQRAFNDAQASFDTAKEGLMTTDDDIKDRPNIKDREALANSKLKNELLEVQKYANDLSDLNNLLRAVSLKLRNLSRANTDIKMQLRVMEAQIKLGTPSNTDSVTKSLIDELSSGIFEDSETATEEMLVVDPSEPLNVDKLLTDSTNNVLPPAETCIVPITDSSATASILETEPISEEWVDSWPEVPEDAVKEIESTPEKKPIDIDKLLEEQTNIPGPSVPEKGGETPKTEINTTKISDEKPKINKDALDLDALLGQYK
jgi:hypothetical protein